MLDKRQKVILPSAQVAQEVFRSMKVEVTSKTPYTDATQVIKNHITNCILELIETKIVNISEEYIIGYSCSYDQRENCASFLKKILQKYK